MENFSHIKENFSSKEINDRVVTVKEELKTNEIKSKIPYTKLMDLLDQLLDFPLGRFLLMNKGLNGLWTDYIINYPNEKINQLPIVEQMLLTSRVFKATRERQKIFKAENQTKINNDANIAVIPAGLMSEVLDLDYTQTKLINILGIDLDPDAEKYSRQKYSDLYQKYNIAFEVKNALELDYQEQFDLISSNGLSIYIQDNALVQQLFNGFYNALKTGGKLVTSFLTYPTIFGAKSEQKPIVDVDKYMLEVALFVDIIGVRWNAFRTTTEIVDLLTKAQFKDLKILPDSNYIFPTITAYKHKK